MKAAIYIEISSTPSFEFEKPILQSLKSQYPDITLYDLDSNSDASIITYAKDLMAEVSKYILIIDIKENDSAAKIIPLLEANLRHKQKSFVILNGSSPVIEKMLSLLPPDHLAMNIDAVNQLKYATKFFNGNSNVLI